MDTGKGVKAGIKVKVGEESVEWEKGEKKVMRKKRKKKKKKEEEEERKKKICLFVCLFVWFLNVLVNY